MVENCLHHTSHRWILVPLIVLRYLIEVLPFAEPVALRREFKEIGVIADQFRKIAERKVRDRVGVRAEHFPDVRRRIRREVLKRLKRKLRVGGEPRTDLMRLMR